MGKQGLASLKAKHHVCRCRWGARNAGMPGAIKGDGVDVEDTGGLGEALARTKARD